MRHALFLSTALVFAASSASAETRSTTMSCAQVSALVQERGQVVFDTGGGELSRVVANPSSCDPSQDGAPSWIPSQDQSQCLAGYRCQERQGHGN
ncbi:hypothetical protein [Ancylobacter sp.]|uniref:hypothetical protein n=1 Tax=Ancylobacter sp. TaxID=1872567 RepID=UPI003D0FBF67